MRAVYVIPLCGLVVVVGVVFAIAGNPTLPVPSATTRLSSAALPLPPPPSTSRTPSPAPKDAPATPATAGLACIQDALGGARAFAGVSSLRIVGNTKPTAISRPRPAPGRREIGVVFPERYKSHSLGVSPSGPLPPLITGFNGDVLLSSLRPPNDVVAGVMMRAYRLNFVHQMLMRLPRELAGVRLSQRTTRDSGQERLTIVASGLDGLRATLLANSRTCVPVAVEYRSGSDNYRVDLSEYRPFSGIRFPTVLQYAKDGEPWQEERVSAIQVNPPLDDEYFRQ